MCGIAGVLGSRTQERRQLGYRMLNMLYHRGPDAGYLFDNGRAMLGTRRLSIVNLENGVQPAFSENRDIVCVFNGEIYNHVELRKQLEDDGFRLRDGSDIEVIPAAYQKWGLDFVSHFNGDFAIALWDNKREQLILARDRAGVKPLYYAKADNGDLVFASEIKSIFAHPGVRRAFDTGTLSQIFTFWTPVDGCTPFAGVKQVESGTLLRFSAQGELLDQRRYWDVPYNRHQPLLGGFNDYKDAFHDQLKRSVKLRLQADVEVSTYTSGGIDSAVIAYIAYKELRHKNIQTFSVGFDDPQLDEEKYQRMVAASLGLDYSAVKVSSQDIYRNFLDTVLSVESPLFRTAPVPMRMLSQLVRAKGVKVVLSGEGSDEVNWGYDIFREAKVRRFWARQPSSKVRPLLFRRMYHYLPQFQDPRYFNLTIDFFKKGLLDIEDPLYTHTTRIANSTATHAYFSDAMRQAITTEPPLEKLLASLPGDYADRTMLERCQYLEMKTLLSGYLLSAQGDKMMSANSVEGRFPYLDHHFIEFMAQVPPQYKLCGLKDKHLLRESYRDKLPPDIVYRPKHAYRAPEMQAFVEDPDGYVRDLLSPDHIKEAGVFDPDKTQTLYAKLKTGNKERFSTRDNLAFVQILSTQATYELFMTSCDFVRTVACDVTMVEL